MVDFEQGRFYIDGVASISPADRLAAIHRASDRIQAENRARDRAEVPFIVARLAAEAARLEKPDNADAGDINLPPAA